MELATYPPGANHVEFNQNQGYEYPKISGEIWICFHMFRCSYPGIATPFCSIIPPMSWRCGRLDRPWMVLGGRNEQNQNIHGGLVEKNVLYC